MRGTEAGSNEPREPGPPPQGLSPAARYRALLAACPDAVFLVGGDGRVLELNRAAERLWGLPASEILGRSIAELARADGRAGLLGALEQAASEGQVVLPGVRLVNADGTEVIAECSAAGVVEPAAEGGSRPRARATILLARDVTDRARMERLAHDNERLLNVGTLAAGIAHEINNPTAYVLANLSHLQTFQGVLRTTFDALLDELADTARVRERRAGFERDFARLLSEFDELVRESIHGGERIRGIVSDLRSFSREGSDELEPVRLHEALDAALRLAGSEIRYRATVRRDYAADVPEIVASAGRLNQVFLNLVVNAVQAMDRGGPADNVLSVATRLDGGGVRIDVGDTGPGIPAGILPRIFDPFFTTKPAGQGTGLGLSICRDLVRRHGGEVSVRSSIGHGTTFSVWLPLGTTRAAAAIAAPAVVTRERRASGRRARILVVDDEPHLLRAYERLLGRSHELVTAAGGQAAQEALDGGLEFDLIISDLVMPEVDGVALHAAIHQRDPELARRMIFITGGAFTERAGRFLEAIENPRLEKPVGIEELQRAIEELLSRG